MINGENRRKPAICKTIRETAKQHYSKTDRVNKASLIILNNIYVLPHAIFQKLLLPVKQKKAAEGKAGHDRQESSDMLYFFLC
jgi:hypothetical protein